MLKIKTHSFWVLLNEFGDLFILGTFFRVAPIHVKGLLPVALD